MAKPIRVPSPYTVLLAFVLLSALATWLIPAGHYDKLNYDASKNVFVIETTEGQETQPADQATLSRLKIDIKLEKFVQGKIRKPIAIPGTYVKIAQKPSTLLDVLQAPLRGIYDSIDVILFVLVMGGFIEIFNKSGAFEAGIDRLSKKLEGREKWLIVIIASLIGLGGTIFGMAEETLAFYPILVPVFLVAGYDLIVPVAAIYLGSSVGIMASTVNPFSTIIASDAAGINWTDGLIGRVAMLVIFLTVTIVYVLRYAKKVKADPQASLVANDQAPPTGLPATEVPDSKKMNRRKRLILVVFGLTFICLIVGVSTLDWWFLEMTTLFVVSSAVMAIIHGMGEKSFFNHFIKGAESLLGISFIIGFARAVTLLLTDGQVSDSLLHFAAVSVAGLPHSVFIISLFSFFAVFGNFIPSQSGMAVLTMPIMGSLGNLLGVPNTQIVNSYQFGLNLMGIISPSGLLLASLAMVNVDYFVWLKFIWKLTVLLAVISIISLVIGVGL